MKGKGGREGGKEGRKEGRKGRKEGSKEGRRKKGRRTVRNDPLDFRNVNARRLGESQPVESECLPETLFIYLSDLPPISFPSSLFFLRSSSSSYSSLIFRIYVSRRLLEIHSLFQEASREKGVDFG